MAAQSPKLVGLFCLILVALCAWSAGCEGGNWLSFNIVLDLGLDGESGLLTAFSPGSNAAPSTGGSNTEPPTPVQVGDPLGGATGGTTGGTSVVN